MNKRDSYVKISFGLWIELLCHDRSTGPNNLTDPQRPNFSKQKYRNIIAETLQSVLGKHIAVLQLKQLTVQSGFGLSYSNFLYTSHRGGRTSRVITLSEFKWGFGGRSGHICAGSFL